MSSWTEFAARAQELVDPGYKVIMNFANHHHSQPSGVARIVVEFHEEQARQPAPEKRPF